MNCRHPSVVASMGALVVFAVAEVAIDIPWWLWAVWAVLTAASAVQALRSETTP